MIKGRLAIFGAGGHGKVVGETALASGWQEIVFYDDEFPYKRFTGNYVVSGKLKTLSLILIVTTGVMLPLEQIAYVSI